MKPYIHYGASLWNLHASVGKFGHNNVQSDVCYIQWYYTLAAEHPETPQERKEVYKYVRVTGSCTGRDDDPLVKSITIHQQGLHHAIIDGRISPLPGEAGNLRVGDKAFFVIRLGARIATMFPKYWPRLDLMPRCPPSVAQAVLEAIPKV